MKGNVNKRIFGKTEATRQAVGQRAIYMEKNMFIQNREQTNYFYPSDTFTRMIDYITHL